jgi:hypothetical protein
MQRVSRMTHSPWTASYALEVNENSNAAAMKAFREWWRNNMKALDIIERRISPIIANLLSQDPHTTS